MQFNSFHLGRRYRLDTERGDPGRPWLGSARDETGATSLVYQRPVRTDLVAPQLLATCERLLGFRHPLVSSLVDVALVEGTAILIYEPIIGQPLSEILAGKLPLSEVQACSILYDALEGLGALASAGLHHGDLHLDRLVVRRDDKRFALLAPVPDSLDLFGPPAEHFPVAELVDVAPERLAPIPCNLIAGDCYAVGMLVARLLGAGALADSDDPTELVELIRLGMHDGLDERLPQVTARVREVLRTCLSPDLHQRYGNPSDLRHDLNLVIATCDPQLAGKIRAGQHRSTTRPTPARASSTTLDIQAISDYLANRNRDTGAIMGHAAIAGASQSPLALADRVKRLARLVSISGDGMRAWIKLGAGVRFPEELLRKTLALENICCGVQEGGILQATTPRNEVRRIVLALGEEAGPGRAGRTVQGKVLAPLRRRILIRVQEDRMSAQAELAPGCIPNYQDIQEACLQAGVVHGLDRALIDRLVDQGASEDRFSIAEGTPPRDAIAPGFDLVSETGHAILVKGGDLVGEWRPGRAGIAGRDVHGEPVPAKEATELDAELLAGPGTSLVNRGGRASLVASRDGVVRCNEMGMISVRAVEIVTGDLRPGEGPLVVDKVLIIRGSILDGGNVECADDLIVEGDVGDARLVVGGELVVAGAILDGTAEIAVIGDLTAASLGRRQVVATDVRIHGDILNAEVIASGELHACRVIGGMVTAFARLQIDEIGDDYGTDTLVWAGRHIPRAIQRDLALMDARRVGQERELLLREQHIFERVLRELGNRQALQEAKGYMRHDYRAELAGRLERVRQRLEKVRDHLDGKRVELRDKRQGVAELDQHIDNHDGEVEVAGTIHAGVRLKIADAGTRTIDRTQQRVVLRL